MQCGPAPLEAIRRGDIGLGYDVPFVFSEVNADIMHFHEDKTSDWGWSRTDCIKTGTGLAVSIFMYTTMFDFYVTNVSH